MGCHQGQSQILSSCSLWSPCLWQPQQDRAELPVPLSCILHLWGELGGSWGEASHPGDAKAGQLVVGGLPAISFWFPQLHPMPVPVLRHARTPMLGPCPDPLNPQVLHFQLRALHPFCKVFGIAGHAPTTHPSKSYLLEQLVPSYFGRQQNPASSP